MRRRDFMIGAAGTTAGMLLLPELAHAEANRIDWYTSSDTTVLDFWANIVKPRFEQAHPGVTLNLLDGGDGGALGTIAERAWAAMQANQDPRVDMFEEYDPRLPKGSIEAGLWTDFSKAGLSNYDRINPITRDLPQNLPWHGSQVLLAFDTTKLAAADAPTNWDELVTWIKAHPGEFIYCRPDKGGSGNNFIQRTIYQANGLDPDRFTLDNFSPEKAKEMLDPAWELLKDIGPSTFGQGAYTSGNTQSVQLLSQSAVTMITVWSDQVLSSIAQGVLPETTGLVQLQDLPMSGGYAQMVVFANAANHDITMKLVDFVLSDEIQQQVVTELAGFPAIKWEYFPPEVQEKFKSVMASSMPDFPGGDWTNAVTDGWYRNVAPGVDRTT
jgi:putative spermidine/putrescine transport system substrate-binding protein